MTSGPLVHYSLSPHLLKRRPLSEPKSQKTTAIILCLPLPPTPMCCAYKDCNARVSVWVIRNCTEAIMSVQQVLVLTEPSPRIHLWRTLTVVSNSLLQRGSHWLFVWFQGEMGATGPVA